MHEPGDGGGGRCGRAPLRDSYCVSEDGPSTAAAATITLASSSLSELLTDQMHIIKTKTAAAA